MRKKKEEFIDIGHRIKLARERIPLTQETLAKICIALGCTSDYIIFGITNEDRTSNITNKLSYLSDEQLKATEQALNILSEAMVDIKK